MTRFQFGLADSRDDADLRQRMAQDRMEGTVAVSFRREPSYFIGAGVQGDQGQVIKCVDTRSGQLVGLGARMQLDAYINNHVRRIGYLGDLRAAPHYRGGTLLARGYRYLRTLHEADPVPFYFSLILEGNSAALQSLTGARAGLPVYQDHGRVLTPAIHLDIPRKTITETGLSIQAASDSVLPAVFEFIRKQYSGKQFAPVYQASDIGGSRLYGLKAEDILVATRGNRIVGTIAAWDQRGFRQTYVERYNPKLKFLRPFYNVAAALSPLKPLPKEGSVVPYFYLALAAVEDDEPAIFRALLSHLYNQRRRGSWHYFIAGFHQRHPFAQVLAEYRSIEAAGQLYLVYYPEDEAGISELDDRVPHIEIGAI